ncbi:DUF438 domain-containing protein [Bacteroidota bacterium]
MSEIINNSRDRIEALKKIITEIHAGSTLQESQQKLKEMLSTIPYSEVVIAEQELISGGMPVEEIQKHCDLHSEALKKNLDVSSTKTVPEGHPVHTFIEENKKITKQLDTLTHIFEGIQSVSKDEDVSNRINEIHSIFNSLMDIEKHYSRKENLLFPYLEKYEITGPPMVMWGKDDEVRGLLKSSISSFETITTLSAEDLLGIFELLFNPAIKAIEEMVYKEEKILFPMSMDTLNEIDWFEIYSQSNSIGYCLYDPPVEWTPDIEIKKEDKKIDSSRIQLSTGSFTVEELEAFFGALPVDITFVDKDDKVRYFSHGKNRIFERNRAILGREVQYCHPPSSVHIVEKILNDFKSGTQNEAVFWISFQGMYVHIAYYAVRDKDGNYLGTLEVTQDVQQFKDLEGERRLLTYDK